MPIFPRAVATSCRLLTGNVNVLRSLRRHRSNDVIFSGIQPTGVPHIGNYLGAVKHWVQLQQTHDNVIYCIVDLHSITTQPDPGTLRANIMDMAMCLLACGLDPEKSIIFQQSMVSEHAELAWVFSCLTTLPQLQHQPQWRAKTVGMENPGVGLLTYPVLQSADILLYKTTHVPVGEDQVKHVELTRNIARTFNKRFGQFFPEPRIVLTETRRIKSLRNPAEKMSKTDPNPKTRIDLTDEDDVIVMRIQKAVTDALGRLTYEPERRPGVANLIDIHCGISGLSPDDVCEQCAQMNMSEYKSYLSELVLQSLRPIREEYLRLKSDEDYVRDVINKGSDKARSIASANFTEIKNRVGLS